ncbi:MAG: Rv3654c family TadE-like protein [Angustibacter sp.]
MRFRCAAGHHPAQPGRQGHVAGHHPQSVDLGRMMTPPAAARGRPRRAEADRWPRHLARRRAHPRQAERGTATAELATALPAVTLALGTVLGVGHLVAAKVGCVDAARAGARAAARGESDPVVRQVAVRVAGGSPSVSIAHGSWVTVTVARAVDVVPPLGPELTVRCTSVASAEHEDDRSPLPGFDEPAPGARRGVGPRRALPSRDRSELDQLTDSRLTDEGSAAVLVLAVGMLAILLASALSLLGSAVIARHRAASVADLAALAAADVLVGRTVGSPCPAARAIATVSGATLSSCVVVDGTALVSASVRPAGLAGRLGVARAWSRAGAAATPTTRPALIQRHPGLSGGGA